MQTYIIDLSQDLPTEIIKKERKKILSARKPGKEFKVYVSDPELGSLEVYMIHVFIQSCHFHYQAIDFRLIFCTVVFPVSVCY